MWLRQPCSALGSDLISHSNTVTSHCILRNTTFQHEKSGFLGRSLVVREKSRFTRFALYVSDEGRMFTPARFHVFWRWHAPTPWHAFQKHPVYCPSTVMRISETSCRFENIAMKSNRSWEQLTHLALYKCLWRGRDNLVGNTPYGVEHWSRRDFFRLIQTGPEAHPISCTMGTGSLSRR
jgi:hypothetical protein